MVAPKGETDYQLCLGDKLVGDFDQSRMDCFSNGFDPTFTYNPGAETQDVTIDITLGKYLLDFNPPSSIQLISIQFNSINFSLIQFSSVQFSSV